jgi:hypothetical protein
MACTSAAAEAASSTRQALVSATYSSEIAATGLSRFSVFSGGAELVQ